MKSVEIVKVGLFGLGTVGRGLVDLLRDHGSLLERRTGLRFEIAAVCDRSWEKKKALLSGIPASSDPQIILGRDDIRLVVELIGGLEPARSVIRGALESGRSVVTANKALLAQEGQEIFRLAAQKGGGIGFEAAVAGALPVIKTMRRTLVINEVRALYGIVNGTCNFIITRMEEDQMGYGEALALAQARGFAEADPTFDVDGRDAAQKLAVLSSLAFDVPVTEDDVRAEGIRDIRPVDLKIAESMGWVIRLLAVAKRPTGAKLLIRVHPAMIHRSHALASVRDEKNAVFYETTASGPLMVMGLGAGALPTASAVISDMVALARNKSPEVWSVSGVAEIEEDASYRFYLRFQTVDERGVLAELAHILAEEDISIASVHQQEGKEPVDVVIITHSAQESGMFRALGRINKLRIVLAPTVFLRIEDKL